MSAMYDCSDPAQRTEGLAAAAAAVLGGDLVVLPTDTVYGIGADAFRAEAVTALLRPRGGAARCRRRCWSARSARPPRWSTISARTGRR